MTIDLQTLLQAAFGLGFSILMYFVRNTMQHIEKSMTDLQEQSVTIRLMQAQLTKIQDDVKDAGKFAAELSLLSGKLAIAERNLDTCFRKLDDHKIWASEKHELCEKDLELLRKRSHFVANRLMVIKAGLEKANGMCFTDNWGMP